jgi:hypothetical protein
MSEEWKLVREAYQVLLTTPVTAEAANKAEELLRQALIKAAPPLPRGEQSWEACVRCNGRGYFDNGNECGGCGGCGSVYSDRKRLNDVCAE